MLTKDAGNLAFCRRNSVDAETCDWWQRLVNSTDIGVYWKARRENTAQCAERLIRHFSSLASISDNLMHWYCMNERAQKIGDPFNVRSLASLESLLLDGVNRKDIGGEIMPDLGFRVGLWNGDCGGWSAGTSIGCGMYWDTNKTSNVALLTVDFGEVQPLPVEKLVDVLRQLIETWDPDTGKIWQSYLYPNAKDENAEWRERVLAEFQSARTSPAAGPTTSTANGFNGGTLSIDDAQRKYFG